MEKTYAIPRYDVLRASLRAIELPHEFREVMVRMLQEHAGTDISFGTLHTKYMQLLGIGTAAGVVAEPPAATGFPHVEILAAFLGMEQREAQVIWDSMRGKDPSRPSPASRA